MPQSVLEQKRNSELLYVDTVSANAVGGRDYLVHCTIITTVSSQLGSQGHHMYYIELVS